MKEGWKYLPFEKSIVKVKKTKSIKSKDYKEEGQYPVVSQESSLISGYFDDASILYKHDTPVVIFGDHTQNVKYIDFDFIVGADGVHILSPIAEITPKFFYYQLKSIKLRNLGYARHYKLLKQESIGYPPLSEQERIVSLLDAEFAKIDAIKANAEKQLKEAKALFQSTLKDYLTPKEGWVTKALCDICLSIKDGDWIEKKDQSESGIRLIQTGNIGVGVYKDKLESAHFINSETFNRLRCEEVFADDILISRLPEPVGRTCIVPPMDGRFITAVDCSIIKLKTTVVKPEYFLLYTQSREYFNNILSLCTGTTRQRISRKKLAEVKIPIPPIDEQELIASHLYSISAKIQSLQSNFDTTVTLCNDLKQSILEDIFS